jgi:hypothetical protein
VSISGAYQSKTLVDCALEGDGDGDGDDDTTLPSFVVLGVVVVDVIHKVSEVTLLEHAHQIGAHCLLGSGRDLVDLVVLEHVAALNTSEFQVAGYLGVQEQFHQVACVREWHSGVTTQKTKNKQKSEEFPCHSTPPSRTRDQIDLLYTCTPLVRSVACSFPHCIFTTPTPTPTPTPPKTPQIPTTGHDHLGAQVDVVVTGSAHVIGHFALWLELLEQLFQVQRGRLTTVVIVAVHVQQTLLVDRNQPTEDAFLEASAEDNEIVFLIHVC